MDTTILDEIKEKYKNLDEFIDEEKEVKDEDIVDKFLDLLPPNIRENSENPLFRKILNYFVPLFSKVLPLTNLNDGDISFFIHKLINIQLKIYEELADEYTIIPCEVIAWVESIATVLYLQILRARHGKERGLWGQVDIAIYSKFNPIPIQEQQEQDVPRKRGILKWLRW